MARCKITAYVTPDLGEALRRTAAIDDRSVSDIVEDALLQKLMGDTGAAQQAAIMAGLGRIARHLASLERSVETQFELGAQTARFLMSVAPEVPQADRAAINARGRQRLDSMLAMIAGKLATGRTSLQDALNAAPIEKTASGLEAAE